MFETLFFTEIDSTNEEAKRRLNTSLNAGLLKRPLLIRAESQTAGRGTRGRRWLSPQGAGLYFSIVHPFPEMLSLWETAPTSALNTSNTSQRINLLAGIDAAFTPLFTLAAGVACAEVLRELAHVLVELKPINDLYVGEKKLGGILTESLIGDGEGLARCRGIITGIGINVFDHESVIQGCATEDRHEDAWSEAHTPSETNTIRDKATLTKTQEDKRNHPTSLQACIPATLFAQWSGDAIKAELAHAMAERVDHYYRLLILGKFQERNSPEILERYLLFKRADAELPASLRHVLQAASLMSP